MKPLFFGSSTAPLYGVFYPPKTALLKNEGIVLCYPFGQEYMRAHRAFRQLANLLSRKGYHVIRFDYRGTGDSSGELESVTVTDWIEDAKLAVQELKESAQIDKVSMVGLRLGGVVAASCASEEKLLDKLVLWDPSLSGQSYEQELLDEIDKPDVEPWNFVDESGVLHFNGFPLTPDFLGDLRQYDLLDLSFGSLATFHVVSHESDNSSKLKSSWQNNPGYKYCLAPAPGDWNYVDTFGGILLPQPVIQSIVDWF